MVYIHSGILLSWGRAWQTTPVFLPGESHGQRNLVGCSPWAHKESDTTEQRSIAHYSTKKIKNEIMPFAVMWVDLDIVKLSEVRYRKTNI